MELVAKGGKEESKVHDEASDHCCQADTALSTEVCHNRAHTKAGAPRCRRDQGGDKVGGWREVSRHLQAEHPSSKEQASSESLSKGTACHHHPAPATLLIVVVTNS